MRKILSLLMSLLLTLSLLLSLCPAVFADMPELDYPVLPDGLPEEHRPALPELPQDDAADALALAVCHAHAKTLLAARDNRV